MKGGKRTNAGRKTNAEKGIPHASETRRIPTEIIPTIEEIVQKFKTGVYIPETSEQRKEKETKEFLRSRIRILMEYAENDYEQIQQLKEENEKLQQEIKHCKQRYETMNTLIQEKANTAKETRNWTEFNKLMQTLREKGVI